MKQLRVPIPESLTASYLVPLPTALTGAEARHRAIEAVDAWIGDPIRMLVLEWILSKAATIHVTESADLLAPVPQQPGGLTAEQLAHLTRACAFAQVTASSAASLIAIQEWKALGPAAALAASLGAPLVDAQAMTVLSAPDALKALPDTEFSATPDDIRVGLSFRPWVSFQGLAREGTYWAASEGMRRFGLPEFRVGGCERDLREELKEILSAVTFRVWSDLVAVAQTTPGATGLMSMPRILLIPAELDIHRKDLDRVRGAPNQGGAAITIGLRFDPEQHDRGWLTVCPPSRWDMGWDHFVRDLCHAMFGFEKPPWHYLPDTGALVEAIRSLPEARRRFNDGELPTGSQLMVRYEATDDQSFRWARVQSWADDHHAVVSDKGRELSPAIKLGPAVPVGTERIMDWAIWTDGKGVTEGAITETVIPGC